MRFSTTVTDVAIYVLSYNCPEYDRRQVHTPNNTGPRVSFTSIAFGYNLTSFAMSYI